MVSRFWGYISVSCIIVLATLILLCVMGNDWDDESCKLGEIKELRVNFCNDMILVEGIENSVDIALDDFLGLRAITYYCRSTVAMAVIRSSFTLGEIRKLHVNFCDDTISIDSQNNGVQISIDINFDDSPDLREAMNSFRDSVSWRLL